MALIIIKVALAILSLRDPFEYNLSVSSRQLEYNEAIAAVRSLLTFGNKFKMLSSLSFFSESFIYSLLWCSSHIYNSYLDRIS